VQGSRWWLVCYDVRNAKRLRKTAKHMEGYGNRLQYSVFRCWMTQRQMEKLRWELTQILTAEDDVLIIPLCSRCHAGVSVTHAPAKRPDWPGALESFKIV
jgi:CRISPR-associated protein Cas2